MIRHLRAHPQDYRGALLRTEPRWRALQVFAYQSWLWNEGVKAYLREVVGIARLTSIRYQAGTLLFPRELDAAAGPLPRRGRTFPLLAPASRFEDPGGGAGGALGPGARGHGRSPTWPSRARPRSTSSRRSAPLLVHPGRLAVGEARRGRAQPRSPAGERGLHPPPGRLRHPGGEAALPLDAGAGSRAPRQPPRGPGAPHSRQARGLPRRDAAAPPRVSWRGGAPRRKRGPRGATAAQKRRRGCTGQRRPQPERRTLNPFCPGPVDRSARPRIRPLPRQRAGLRGRLQELRDDRQVDLGRDIDGDQPAGGAARGCSPCSRASPGSAARAGSGARPSRRASAAGCGGRPSPGPRPARVRPPPAAPRPAPRRRARCRRRRTGSSPPGTGRCRAARPRSCPRPGRARPVRSRRMRIRMSPCTGVDIARPWIPNLAGPSGAAMASARSAAGVPARHGPGGSPTSERRRGGRADGGQQHPAEERRRGPERRDHRPHRGRRGERHGVHLAPARSTRPAARSRSAGAGTVR